ncbi:MAG: hypothetical protein M3P10_00025 [Actinomycetota bacterium]|nr:hypothetical protein [Actinomycetota bacterium]
MGTRSRYAALGAVLLLALMVFVIVIGAPLWLEVVALALGGVVWFRYRWITGVREEHHAAVARGRAKGLADRERREAKKRRKRE